MQWRSGSKPNSCAPSFTLCMPPLVVYSQWSIATWISSTWMSVIWHTNSSLLSSNCQLLFLPCTRAILALKLECSLEYSGSVVTCIRCEIIVFWASVHVSTLLCGENINLPNCMYQFKCYILHVWQWGELTSGCCTWYQACSSLASQTLSIPQCQYHFQY